MRIKFTKHKAKELAQFLLVLLLLIAIFFLAVKTLAFLYEQKKNSPAEIETFSASLLYIIQSVFFLVTGALAFLSYLQARETIFSPIKTEIFKLQITALQEVLNFFYPKSEVDFLDDFDLNQIVEINSKKMASRYAHLFFGDNNAVSKQIDDELNKLNISYYPIPGTGSYYPNSDDLPLEIENKDGSPHSPAALLAIWNNYKHTVILCTEKERESQNKLLELTTSPFLPSDLKILIVEFHDLIIKDIEQVGGVLTQVAKAFPESHTRLSDVSDFINNGRHIGQDIWNRYNRNRPKLEDKISEILDYINTYLRINQIIK